MTRRNVYSGAPWEERVAYCRAKRVGDFIAVSGTTAVDEKGAVVAPGDLYGQTVFALRKIERALGELGGSLKDTVRTRTFITDMSRFEDFARAHRRAFEGIDPAATCVEVSKLAAPELLVEVELDAIVSSS